MVMKSYTDLLTKYYRNKFTYLKT